MIQVAQRPVQGRQVAGQVGRRVDHEASSSGSPGSKSSAAEFRQ
jgi:hypothetical protein